MSQGQQRHLAPSIPWQAHMEQRKLWSLQRAKLLQHVRWQRGEARSWPKARPCWASGRSLAVRLLPPRPQLPPEPWPSSQLPAQVWTAPGKALTLFCANKTGAAWVHLFVQGYWHHKAIGAYPRKSPTMPRGKFSAGIAAEWNKTQSNFLMSITLCCGGFLLATPEVSCLVQFTVLDVMCYLLDFQN